MDMILNLLFTVITEIQDKLKTGQAKPIIRTALKPNDPRVVSLIKQGYAIMNMIEAYNIEDVVQDVATNIIKYTNMYITNNNVTYEYIAELISKQEKDKEAAKYWKYINISVLGNFKNRRKARKMSDDIYANDEKNVYFGQYNSIEEVENTLMQQCTSLYNNTENSASTHFASWFKKNMHTMLTKEQAKFIEANGQGYEKRKAYKYREAISKKALKRYYKTFNNAFDKDNEKQERISIIDEILNCKDVSALRKYLDETFIQDSLYVQDTTTAELKYLTAVYKGVATKKDTHYNSIMQKLVVAKNKITKK